MAKKSTSDQLKQMFAQNGGGNEKDWKRLSRQKNHEGDWVREFENRKTGARLEVVETGAGQFKARRLTSEANDNFSMPEDFTRAPVMETDLAKNEAADKVIAILNAPYSEQDEQERECEIPLVLIKKAGQALANRFVFAVGRGKPPFGVIDGLFVEFSARESDYDQSLSYVIGHLLPAGNGGEVLEMTFDFTSWKDPVKLASELMKRGFIWDEDYQESFDQRAGSNYLQVLKSAFGVMPSSNPTQNLNPKP